MVFEQSPKADKQKQADHHQGYTARNNVRSIRRDHVSVSLLTSLAQLDLTNPLGFQDLRGIDTAGRIGIQNRVDYVSATRLGDIMSQCQLEARGSAQTLTRCRVSMGA